MLLFSPPAGVPRLGLATLAAPNAQHLETFVYPVCAGNLLPRLYSALSTAVLATISASKPEKASGASTSGPTIPPTTRVRAATLARSAMPGPAGTSALLLSATRLAVRQTRSAWLSVKAINAGGCSDRRHLLRQVAVRCSAVVSATRTNVFQSKNPTRALLLS